MAFGLPDGSPYALMGMAAESATPNASTDGLVHQLSTRQELSGRFQGLDYRPPMEYSAITFTATALRAMQLYALPGRAAEFRDRIQRASRWLTSQMPRDTEEHALRLMGLSWAAPASLCFMTQPGRLLHCSGKMAAGHRRRSSTPMLTLPASRSTPPSRWHSRQPCCLPAWN